MQCFDNVAYDIIDLNAVAHNKKFGHADDCEIVQIPPIIILELLFISASRNGPLHYQRFVSRRKTTAY
jgi:hypothetical protein